MDDVARPSRRGAFVPSLVAAAGILAYLTITSSIVAVFDQNFAFLAPTVVTFIAIAAACLLSFSLIAPILGRLSPWAVIVRALIAAGVAFLALIPVELAIFSVLFAEVDAGGLYDLVQLDAPNVPWKAIVTALEAAISRLPEITLAALALWWWLRRTETAHGEA